MIRSKRTRTIKGFELDQGEICYELAHVGVHVVTREGWSSIFALEKRRARQVVSCAHNDALLLLSHRFFPVRTASARIAHGPHRFSHHARHCIDANFSKLSSTVEVILNLQDMTVFCNPVLFGNSIQLAPMMKTAIELTSSSSVVAPEIKPCEKAARVLSTAGCEGSDRRRYGEQSRPTFTPASAVTFDVVVLLVVDLAAVIVSRFMHSGAASRSSISESSKAYDCQCQRNFPKHRRLWLSEAREAAAFSHGKDGGDETKDGVRQGS